MSRRVSLFGDTIGEEERKNVIEAVEKGWLSGKGDFVTEFEKRFSEYVDAEGGGVATSAGTTALHLALEALDIGEGDEVIVPDITFVATIEAVRHANAEPVIVDVDSDHLGIDPDKVEENINPDTAAIIPVHLYGHPCDMDPLLKLAEEHDLEIIEDAAEAHGAEYKGQKVGSIGDIGCFSFYASKIMTTGEGGICTSKKQELIDEMQSLRRHAVDREHEKEYWHTEVGFNYNMSNLQAAVGVAQTSKLPEFLEKKREIASYYRKKLDPISGIKILEEKDWANSAEWVFPVILEDAYSMRKSELRETLDEKGVDTRGIFTPLHKLPPYTEFREGDYPVANMLDQKGFYLPNTPNMDRSDVDYIANILRENSGVGN